MDSTPRQVGSTALVLPESQSLISLPASISRDDRSGSVSLVRLGKPESSVYPPRQNRLGNALCSGPQASRCIPAPTYIHHIPPIGFIPSLDVHSKPPRSQIFLSKSAPIPARLYLGDVLLDDPCIRRRPVGDPQASSHLRCDLRTLSHLREYPSRIPSRARKPTAFISRPHHRYYCRRSGQLPENVTDQFRHSRTESRQPA